jgi:hypothetical protein
MKIEVIKINSIIQYNSKIKVKVLEINKLTITEKITFKYDLLYGCICKFLYSNINLIIFAILTDNAEAIAAPLIP